MSQYMGLVTPNLQFQVLAGNCLAMAQGIVGAPIMYASATEAANATSYQHADRNIPGAICVLWFDHWGSYGAPGREVYANWGHVVVYVPGHGFASSSPIAGQVSTPYYYSSIWEVEQAFNCTFRFWSEDINGLRVCEPVKTEPNWEEQMYAFGRTAARTKKQEIKGGEERRVIFNDKGDVSFANGPGDVIATASVRIKGAPGGRAQINVVYETVTNNTVNSKPRIISSSRVIIDSLGMAEVSLPVTAPLSTPERARIIIHTSESAGKVTVDSARISGFARAGK